MHEGSVRRREDGIYIIGLSVCPSGHVFIIVPSSFLMPIYLFVWQTQCPISLFKPPNNLSLDDYIMLELQSAQSYFVQSILWTCAFQNACVFVSICEFPLQELTRALFSLRRINQASATWPRWLQPSWAQLIRVPCGPDMRRTKKQEEWEEAQDRRTSRQWMIMMTRAILLASVHPPRPPLSLQQQPWPWPWLWLPHGLVIWLGSAWVKCHHQAGSGLSAVGDDRRRGAERRDVRNRGWGICTIGEEK